MANGRRSVWSGSIVFGMVSIPVKAYTATTDKDIHFHTMHTCGTRLNYKRWCPTDDREVFAEEIQRVYEWAKDHYVEITNADLDALPVPSKRTVELSGFLDLDAVDPAYVEKTYWLEPEATGLKPYSLLMRIMTNKGVMGIAKVSIRSREQICILRTSERALLMETLFWPDEVRLEEIPTLPEVMVSDTEMRLASDLVEALRMPFQPEQYVDTYRTSLIELVEHKKEGLPVEQAPAALPAPTIDVSAALSASLADLKLKASEAAPPASEPEQAKSARRPSKRKKS